MGGKPRGEQRREKPSQSPVQHINFAALRQMGCSEEEIIRGLGLTKETRHEVDRMVNLYQMLHHGLPKGVFGESVVPIKCPRCKSLVKVIPCVKCTAEGAWPSRCRDQSPNITNF